MEKIINIIPATKIPPDRNQVFSYLCPNNINVKPGQEVLIPFAGREISGIVSFDENVQANIGKFKLKSIIEIVDDNPVLNQERFSLAKWISEYYLCSIGQVIKLFLPKRINLRAKQNNYFNENCTEFPKLNSEQQSVYDSISGSLKDKTMPRKERAFLIHGITGSGKTEIYMKLVEDAIKRNKQAIIMVPEISLTPQTVNTFISRFGRDKVALLHSKLSGGEKYKYWQDIRNNKSKIIIGPRSAIFSPVFNLGLIVIDEEHDSSYKQYDQTPRYHARDVALKLSDITNSPIILGSATPSVESYHHAKSKNYVLLELKNRFKKDLKLPLVKTIDMREEFKKGNYNIFSESLLNNINSTLENNKQILLFVNRRGASTFVMCRDCGYVVECPNCSVSLTHHTAQNSNIMLCHHCGYKENVKILCPKCDSKYIKYFGLGTQRVEQEINNIIPRAKVLRMDGDTMNKKGIHDKVYNDFSNRKFNILIGTQMITKGLDLSNIELVGIIATDVLFNFPDFRTNERAFQTITQVAGRTSRKENTGKVIMQTYNPDNYIIQSAAKHNYVKFYNKEIKLREELQYPPYRKLLKIIFEGNDYQALSEKTLETASIIKHNIKNIEIIGPSPAFIPKRRNKYIWHIILKYSDNTIRKKIIKYIPSDCKIDIDPENLL